MVALRYALSLCVKLQKPLVHVLQKKYYSESIIQTLLHFQHVSANINGGSEISRKDTKFLADLKNCSKSVLCKTIDGKLNLQLLDMHLEILKLIFHG